MPLIWRASIHSYLVALVVAVAAPLLALLGYLLYLEAGNAVDRAGQAAVQLAQRTAAETERYFDGNRSWMERAARRAAIREMNPRNCDPLIKDLQSLAPRIFAIYMTNRRGELICSGQPAPAGTTFADREWFKRVVSERRFVVGEATVGRVSGRWISVQAQPILDDAGAVIGTLSASLDLETYDPAANAAFLPPDSALLVADDKGTVVAARVPGSEEWIGRNIRDAGFLPPTLDQVARPAAGVGPDGIERLFAAAPIADSGWRAIAGVPLDPAYRDLRRNAARLGLLTLATLVLCIGLGIYGGGKLAAPIRRIAGVARQVSQGRFDARAEVAGPAEIAEVAGELNRMLAMYQTALDELGRSEERYRLIVETANDGIWVGDPVGRTTFVNQQMAMTLGYAPQEMIGRYVREFLAAESRLLARAIVGRRATLAREQHEFSLMHRDGREVWVIAATSPMVSDDGRNLGVLGMVTDITERKKAERGIENATRQVQALSRRLAEAEEGERKRLARELHDQVGQNLATLNVNLAIVRALLDPSVAAKAQARLDDSLALVNGTIERVRNVMSELRPPVLDDYGLAAALRWYGGQFSQRTEIAVELHGNEPSPRLAPQIETAYFRIAQEALNNVLKHARARRVDITLEQAPDAVTLTFADDGAGFDSAAAGAQPTGCRIGAC